MTYAYQSLSDLQDHRRCPEVDTAFKDQLFPPNKSKWMEVGKVLWFCGHKVTWFWMTISNTPRMAPGRWWEIDFCAPRGQSHEDSQLQLFLEQAVWSVENCSFWVWTHRPSMHLITIRGIIKKSILLVLWLRVFPVAIARKQHMLDNVYRGKWLAPSSCCIMEAGTIIRKSRGSYR